MQRPLVFPYSKYLKCFARPRSTDAPSHCLSVSICGFSNRSLKPHRIASMSSSLDQIHDALANFVEDRNTTAKPSIMF